MKNFLSSGIALSAFLSLTLGKPTSYTPLAYSVGSSPLLNGLSTYAGREIELSTSSPLLTLDYGAEVGGFPFLEVSSLSAPVQVELKYTEAFGGLEQDLGDGPWTFANGLSNTFRTETFNITAPGRYESYFIQGGLRWQSVSLLTSGPINISMVGLRPSVDIYPATDLPGSLETSKQQYTDIWKLGARAVQVACVDAGSQPSTWEVTNQGMMIRGQLPAQSAKGVGLGNYTMSFSTKIVRGGTGWRVAAGISGYGPYFVLTSNYPSVSTFANTNRTLLPPNSLNFGYGWSIVNQTTLTSGPTQMVALPMTVQENQWYEISTAISSSGFNVSINGKHVALFSTAEAEALSSALFSGGTYPTDGTWGFGPFSDQIAYFTNVSVVAKNGTKIYKNTLTSTDALNEFGVAPNNHSYCLDGPKRDRIVWVGDFVHTARTIAASTNRLDFVQGLIANTFERQLSFGLIPTSALMGGSAEYKEAYYPTSYGLTDYQIFMLIVLGEYYQTSGDLATLKSHWPQTKLLTSAMLSKIDPITGLMGGGATDFYFLASGYLNTTAPSALFAMALEKLTVVATALNDNAAAKHYSNAAFSLKTAINALLWSNALGTYSVALLDPGNFSVAGTAFTIMAGVANKTQATSSISKLSQLFHSIGYKDSSAVPSTTLTQLSPNIQGFLLESLFLAHLNQNVSVAVVAPVIHNLLDVFWPQMLPHNSDGRYSTGATWEYVYPDGSPGLGLFTSLSHPWGSAPTYVLSAYVLGVRPVQPGYATWVFEPVVVREIGLTSAKGKVPTPKGRVAANWSVDVASGKVTMSVMAPTGTSGSVKWMGGVVKGVTKAGVKQAFTAGSTEVKVLGGAEVVVVFQT